MSNESIRHYQNKMTENKFVVVLAAPDKYTVQTMWKIYIKLLSTFAKYLLGLNTALDLVAVLSIYHCFVWQKS